MGNEVICITGNTETLLDAVAATGASSTRPMGRLHKVFSIVISGTATVAIQGSAEGTTWHTLASSTTTAAYANAEAWPLIRASVTAYTSGTVSVFMAQ